MEYRRINKELDEVRLITILPRGADDEIIRCQLECFPLDARYLSIDYSQNGSQLEFSRSEKTNDRSQKTSRYTWGDYMALSYTWGNSEFPQNILLNGCPFPITKNLYAALQSFRENPAIKAGCKMWIDSICINQRDILERQSEIMRMQHIYLSASEVVVWLGDSNHDSDSTMEFINALSGCWEVGREKSLGEALRQQLSLHGQHVWTSLNDLMDRSYWHRLWVIQELAMGSINTPVVCGNSVVSWRDLHTALYYLNSPPADTLTAVVVTVFGEAKISLEELENHRVYWKLNRAQDMLDFQYAQQRGLRLDHAILSRFGRQKSASDQRDKVYGLLGLLDSSISSKVNPSYDSELVRVYADFSRAWICGTNSLEVLSECGISRNWPEPKPSWVPDWSFKYYRHLTASYEPKYNSGGVSAYPVSFSFDNNTMTCKVLIIDQVDGMSAEYGESPKGVSDGFVKTVTHPIHSSNGYGTEAALREALWRTLVGNRDLQNHGSHSAPSGYSSVLYSYRSIADEVHLSNSQARYYNFIFIKRNEAFSVGGRHLEDYFSYRKDDQDHGMMNTIKL